MFDAYHGTNGSILMTSYFIQDMPTQEVKIENSNRLLYRVTTAVHPIYMCRF
jgi:hypothetical protein